MITGGYVIKIVDPHGTVQYFSGEKDGLGRPICGDWLESAKLYEERLDGDMELNELLEHRKGAPSLWHRPKRQGGYGLDKLSLMPVIERQAKRIRRERKERSDCQDEYRRADAERILRGTKYKVVKK